MKSFRQHYLAKVLSLLTGVIFLNMSFFMAEVAMLKLTDQQIIENIAKLASNGPLEEERDGESGTDSSAKEVDLMVHQALIHHSSLFLISSKTNRMLEDLYPHANYSLTFTPPPDGTRLS